MACLSHGKKTETQMVIPNPFNSILLRRALKRRSSKPSVTHSAKQPQHRQELETLWRGEQGREKSPSSPAPENNKGDFPPFNRRSRRSEPWLLLTWSRASSLGLLLTPKRSLHEDVEAERQDKQSLSGMCCPEEGFQSLQSSAGAAPCSPRSCSGFAAPQQTSPLAS